MSKRIILFSTLFFLCLFFNSTYANAQEVTPTPTPAPVSYDLAYPGLLPDNPLYKLKVLREKIIEAMIADPRKKVEYYLLQTDKGILASAILIDKKEIDLAYTTALKAENNYTLLVGTLHNLPTKPDDAFFKKLETAAMKHQEVLASLIKRIPQDKQAEFTQILSFSKRNLDSIEQYKHQE